MFREGGRVGTKPVSVKIPQEHITKMAKGGLASEAARVAHSGVGGDTMIIHINKDEFEKLRKEWGEPTVNPHTGMPQFTPFYKQSWFAPVAGLVGTALMATGFGAPIGAALLGEGLAGTTLAGATGIGALGSTTLGTVAGNMALGAGIGGLSGGLKGAALSGGLAGLGSVGASALGNYMGTGSVSGLSSSDAKTLDSALGKGFYDQNINIYQPGPEGAAASGGWGSGLANAAKGFVTDPNKLAATALVLGDMAGANDSGSSQDPATATGGTSGSKSSYMGMPLNTAALMRTRAVDPGGYYKYGKMPERVFFRDNSINQQDATQEETVKAARGGPLTQYVQGGGTGRSDSINAKLSDGEYVMDAETVALLGDGSSKAGAERLDQFRANIRKQKGQALAKGKISPDARDPEHYLMGGRA